MHRSFIINHRYDTFRDQKCLWLKNWKYVVQTRHKYTFSFTEFNGEHKFEIKKCKIRNKIGSFLNIVRCYLNVTYLLCHCFSISLQHWKVREPTHLSCDDSCASAFGALWHLHIRKSCKYQSLLPELEVSRRSLVNLNNDKFHEYLISWFLCLAK